MSHHGDPRDILGHLRHIRRKAQEASENGTQGPVNRYPPIADIEEDIALVERALKACDAVSQRERVAEYARIGCAREAYLAQSIVARYSPGGECWWSWVRAIRNSQGL